MLVAPVDVSRETPAGCSGKITARGMIHQGLWHPGEDQTKKAPKEKALKILEI
jgi:hypothetical protein